MTLNIAICDDEAKEFEPLCHLLDICSFQFNIDLHIDTYTSAQALLTRYRESTGAPYQLLFLDIEMPDGSGITLADVIKRNFDHHVMIVLSATIQSICRTVLPSTPTISFKSQSRKSR